MLENPKSHTKKIVQKRISVTNSNCSQIVNQFYALDYRGDSRWVHFDKILSGNYTRSLSPVDFSSLDFVPYRYTGTAWNNPGPGMESVQTRISTTELIYVDSTLAVQSRPHRP